MAHTAEDVPSKRIVQIRGKTRYEEGLKHLRHVRGGSFEGALPIFKKRAGRLLRFHDTLSESRVSRLITWLGLGKHRSTEDALKEMKTRRGRHERS